MVTHSFKPFNVSDVSVTKHLGGTASPVHTETFQANQKTTNYEIPQIQAEKLSYKEVRGKFSEKGKESSRFYLSEHMKTALSVDEEEESRIQAEVEKRIKILFEQMKKEVFEKTYKEAFDLGMANGKTELIGAMKDQIQSFGEAVNLLEGASKLILQANETLIVKIITALTKKILFKEVSADKDYIIRSVALILDQLNTKENFKVFVSPSQYEAISTIQEELIKRIGNVKNFSIEIDQNIQGGGTRVETEFGNIDATIDVQIKKLEDMFSRPEGATG